MNITFVNWYSFNEVIGGLEAVALRLARGLAGRGHSVSLVAVKQVFDTPPGLDRMILPTPHPTDGEPNVRALTDFLTRHRTQVIVCHNAYRKSLGRLLIRVSQALGIRLVFVLHTTPDYFLHKAVRPSFLRPIVLPIRRLKRRCTWRMMYDGCDAFVLLAEPYRVFFGEIVGLSDLKKVRVIHNPNTYSSADYREEQKKNIALFVGRLSSEKGIPALIEIWRSVAPHFLDWKLGVVGDGPLRKMLEAAELPRCEPVGTQQPKPYYERAKLLLVTSDFEGWGMVIPEAMQHGVVPIVFDSYGAASVLLDEGRAGRLIPSGDIREFVRQVERLMEDEETRKSLASYATMFVTRFDSNPICDAWEVLLRGLIVSNE